MTRASTASVWISRWSLILATGSAIAAAAGCTDDDEYKAAYYAWRTAHPEAVAGKSGGAGSDAGPPAQDADAGAGEDSGAPAKRE